MIVEMIDKEAGNVSYPGTAIKLEKTPGKIETPAPLLGEDTNCYLEKLGYSAYEIDQFVREGVLERSEVIE